MAEDSQGTNIIAGTMPFRDGETWYRVSGRLGGDGGAAPLVAVHGGPGTSHDYLRALAELFADRPVVHYDQFGCGNSSHRPERKPTEWTVDLYVEELAALVAHLGLGAGGAADGFHLLGHSWGGMLASEYALRHPSGIRSLTLTDTAAASSLVIESIDGPRDRLRADAAAELAEAGKPDSKEYAEALDGLFLIRHLCRVVPMPDDLARTLGLMAEDPSVIIAMMGTAEGAITGTLQDWSIVERLPGAAVPTLVPAGEFDELQPVAWEPFATLIPAARSHVFAGASHTPFLEVPEDYRAVLGAFLREHDAV